MNLTYTSLFGGSFLLPRPTNTIGLVDTLPTVSCLEKTIVFDAQYGSSVEEEDGFWFGNFGTRFIIFSKSGKAILPNLITLQP